MIFDSHCHAWLRWPYQPAVPDPRTRGRVEQLLNEMDLNQVERALVVCAQIEHNPRNNADVARAVRLHPDRLVLAVDLDSSWSARYHQPGGAQRLRRMAAAWPVRAFTHYLDRADDGRWLCGEEGQAIFAAAGELGLLASLSCYPHQLPAIRELAGRFPQVPVLLHHLGHPAYGPGESVAHNKWALAKNLEQILDCAQLPNIYLKVSGFAYAAQRSWDFPYQDVLPYVKAQYEAFGARRMCWGSDYPVVRFFMTYRQSLEALRTHCDFIAPEDQQWILGKTLAALLKLN